MPIERRIGTAEEHDEAMPIRAVMTMPPAWVVGGFVAAVERARTGAATDVETARGISIPVAEALMWVDALRQTTRDVGRGRDVAEQLARDELVKALTYVRSRVHHHWAPIAYREAGEWVWLRAENLPLPPKGRFPMRAGEAAYTTLLESRSVMSTLDEAVRRIHALIPDSVD